MSKRNHGRHRAPSRLDNAVVVSAKATAVLAATTGGMASMTVAANAAPAAENHTATAPQGWAQDTIHITPGTQDPALERSIRELPTNQGVNTFSFGTAGGTFEVTAPQVEEPAVEETQTVEQTAPEQTQTPATQQTTQAPVSRDTTRPTIPATTPTTTPKPAPETTGNGGAAIVAAAMAQVGVIQDCTALVNNALHNAGYNTPRTGTLWSGLPQVGYTVYSPQPGDVIYYTGQRHVAIYIGNGMAVHGGYPTSYSDNGTAVARVKIGNSGVTYRRVA